MICGRSFMAFAKSDCVIFLAKRAAVMALLNDLSTVACLNSSVESSNFLKLAPPPECALLFSAAPNLRSVTRVPATLAYRSMMSKGHSSVVRESKSQKTERVVVDIDI